jgi:hypothetical protein
MFSYFLYFIDKENRQATEKKDKTGIYVFNNKNKSAAFYFIFRKKKYFDNDDDDGDDGRLLFIL